MKKAVTLILVGVLLGSTAAFAASKIFSDVPSDAWYADAVNSLSEKGIVEGYPNGTFGPTKNVNRAELAVMLDRLIKYMETGEVSSNGTTNLCTTPPTEREGIGGYEYPIDPNYEGLYWLGQLFTAYGCGPERLAQIPGVDGENYTMGSTIWLKNNPEQALLDAFNSLGFVCSDGSSEETTCKEWTLSDIVPVQDLVIKLELLHDNFEQDDCVNCG